LNNGGFGDRKGFKEYLEKGAGKTNTGQYPVDVQYL
jgi:hypothetical protein